MPKSDTLFIAGDVEFVDRNPMGISLPQPWPQLEASQFRPDIVRRIYAFKQFMERIGRPTEADMILAVAGEGFTTDFTCSDLEIAKDDPHVRLKTNFLAAMGDCASEFRGFMPSNVWKVILALGLRPNPTEESTIFSQREHIPYPWWYADAVLHALGKVFQLFLHVQTRINQHTGLFLDHNCDCNHVIRGIKERTVIIAEMPRTNYTEATAAFFTHLLVECYVIGVIGLPTAFNLSPEGEELRRELERMVA